MLIVLTVSVWMYVCLCVLYIAGLIPSPLVSQVLSPTYKQRNVDFRKLFKQLPDTERLIVGESYIWSLCYNRIGITILATFRKKNWDPLFFIFQTSDSL